VLDDNLLSFIRGSIRSTWALELLLLLRKQAPRVYAPEELVLELRATPLLINGCVEQLQKAGLIACDQGGICRYAPASPAIDQLCAQLAQVFEERPVAVINAIVASPNDRLKTFADAFRFTKKDE
jgi:hypothetical protein